MCAKAGCRPDPGNLQFFLKESKRQVTKRSENRSVWDWDQEGVKQHYNICGNRSNPVIFANQPFVQRLHPDIKDIYFFDWPPSPLMELLFFDTRLDEMSQGGKRELAKRVASPIISVAGPSWHSKKMRKSGGRTK